MLNEVVRHVAIPKEWEYMNINQYIKEKSIKMNNQIGIFITNILSKFLENNSYREQKQSKERDFRTPKWEHGEKKYS